MIERYKNIYYVYIAIYHFIYNIDFKLNNKNIILHINENTLIL